MNLVVSTTFGWNIGDQFILSGVKSILRKAWGEIRCVYHDRNPKNFGAHSMARDAAIRCGWADAVVVAGSPGWTTECSGLYDLAIERGLPIYLIGIGAGAPAYYLAQQVMGAGSVEWALQNAKVVICRDEIARDLALKYRSDVALLPCPSCMCHAAGGPRGPERLVALGEHYTGPWNDEGMMAHQAGDLEKSGGLAFYSHDAQDYLSMYHGAEEVVSSRLHASIIASNHGANVVNLWPADDCRCATAWAVYESGMKGGRMSVEQEYYELLSEMTP